MADQMRYKPSPYPLQGTLARLVTYRAVFNEHSGGNRFLPARR